MPVPLGLTLETERLLLRPPVAEDLDGWAAFGADPDAVRFLGGPGPRAVAWRVLATFAGSWALQGFGVFSVVEKASGRWVGRLGPWRPEGWPGPEIAWGLLSDVQGRGYAFEGAVAAIDWAVDHLGWPAFIHTITPPTRPRSSWCAASAPRIGGRAACLSRCTTTPSTSGARAPRIGGRAALSSRRSARTSPAGSGRRAPWRTPAPSAARPRRIRRPRAA